MTNVIVGINYITVIKAELRDIPSLFYRTNAFVVRRNSYKDDSHERNIAPSVSL